MEKFKNILFVVQGQNISDSALEQAAKLIRSTTANLSFLILGPTLDSNLKDIENAYKESIFNGIRTKLEQHNLPSNANFFYETKEPHFVTIIQHVIKNEYDLVIKETETTDSPHTKGLKSTDMSLLRKCPCPVWLCRLSSNVSAPKILTAVDPFNDTDEGRHLNLKLLQIGQTLAQALGGSNEVISCWDFVHEDFYRNSPFAKMESDKVDEYIEEAKEKHKKAMESLIKESNIDNTNLILPRGKAYDAIPAHTEKQDTDIVVMGTVARTGIPGFIIGNTAENILQNLSCSMFAKKPSGFISPIKAY